MILSEIKQTAALAWSPLSTHPSYVALGTLNSTLSSPTLSVYNTTAFETTQLAELNVSEKFVCLDWGVVSKNGTSSSDNDDQQQGNDLGVLAGGMDDASIQLFDVNKILNKEDDYLISKIDKHTKQVNAVKYNPKQAGLLASAGADGNVFFWNLKNIEDPTTIDMQGKNPHTNEEVTSLAWNSKFDSIASTCSSEGLCVIWELKESKHVLKFSNQQKRSYSCIAWNPEVGTELAVASQMDSAPVIEIWDLRKAYAPVKELKGHSDGVLSLSWCPHDSNLLLSSGKDGSCFIWNPSTGEQLGELPPSENWMYDVQWSYRPSILSTASYDSRIHIYSMQDSSAETHPLEESQEAADGEAKEEDQESASSFMGTISSKGTHAKKRLASQPLSKNVFKTAPKWLKRPTGAIMGFGGRIVSFSGKKVSVQCVTGDELAHQHELDTVIEEKNFESFCDQKVKEAQENDEEDEASIWSVMRILFTQDKKRELLKYLGYSEEDIAAEAAKDELPESTSDSSKDSDEDSTKYDQEKIDSIIQNCVITSNWQAAVDICMKTGRLADALVLAASGGADLWNRTRQEYFERQKRPTIALIGKMLNNIDDLVQDGDLDEWRKILAILCTFGEDRFDDLASRLGDRLEENEQYTPATLCYMSGGNFEKTISAWLNAYEKSGTDSSRQGLIRLMQKVVVFQQAYPEKSALSNPKLSEKYTEYATLLASQGELQNALQYLNTIAQSADRDSHLNELRWRVYKSMLKPVGEAPAAPSWAAQEEEEQARARRAQEQQRQRAAQQQQQRAPQQQAMPPHQPQRQGGYPQQPQYGAAPQQQQPPRGAPLHQGGYPQQPQYGAAPQQQQQPHFTGAPQQSAPAFHQPQQPQFGAPQPAGTSFHQPQQQSVPAYQQPQQQQQPSMYGQPQQQSNFSPQGGAPNRFSPQNQQQQPPNQSAFTQQPVDEPAEQMKPKESVPPPAAGEPEANFGLGSRRNQQDESEQPDVQHELTPEQQRIIDVLESRYNYVFSMENLSMIHKQKQRMIEKDLNNLKNQLQSGRVDGKVEEELSALCTNLENKDSKAASANQRTLSSTYRQQSKPWIKGLKFLVQILSKLG